jgi:hypothetical protein
VVIACPGRTGQGGHHQHPSTFPSTSSGLRLRTSPGPCMTRWRTTRAKWWSPILRTSS